MHTVHKKI